MVTANIANFEAFKERIYDAAKKEFPSWATFYINDFVDYKRDFVFDSVDFIKKLGVVEVDNSNDQMFRVRLSAKNYSEELQ